MDRLLIVEDDAATALALRELLAARGYGVLCAADGRQGLRLLFAERPALMVLDLRLPELDGWQVLARARDMSDLPVLVLSGLDAVADRVRALRAGADDYLVKPCEPEELLARIEALLRRSGHREWTGDEALDELRLLPERRAALWHGGEARLSAIEYRLLQVLVRNRGRVVTTEQLLDQVWDDPLAVGRDRVKFGVLRLRRKLRAAGGPGAGDPVESCGAWGTASRPGGLGRCEPGGPAGAGSLGGPDARGPDPAEVPVVLGARGPDLREVPVALDARGPDLLEVPGARKGREGAGSPGSLRIPPDPSGSPPGPPETRRPGDPETRWSWRPGSPQAREARRTGQAPGASGAPAGSPRPEAPGRKSGTEVRDRSPGP